MKTKATNTTSEADTIAAYAATRPAALRECCDALRTLIDKALPACESKIWHGSPVWFDDGNPVVGYSATAKVVKLLFWNGMAFDDDRLTHVGQFQAAQAQYANAADLDAKVIRGWLKLAGANVFDSKAFFAARRNAVTAREL